MPDRICFVYYWATAGGVERVFLNRAEALLRRYPKLEIEIYFYDGGGDAMFGAYGKARHFGNRLRLVKTFDPARYDAVFPVDTPWLLAGYPDLGNKLFPECHTPYPQHREYLQEWQSKLATLIVPSDAFRRVIEGECPALRGKIRVVRNFVPSLESPPPRPPVRPRPPDPEAPALPVPIPWPPAPGPRPPVPAPGPWPPIPPLPAWSGPIFLYFARIDDNKNIAEFIEGVMAVRSRLTRQPIGVVCGPVVPDYPLMEIIDRRDARSSLVVLPPISFEKTHIFIDWLRQKRAVFISCSKGESFGLSVAEAMTAGMPVVISDIPPHAALVANRAKFLYPLGKVGELAAKMAAAVEHYDDLAAECLELAREFSEEAFLSDWEALFTRT